jgi:hypothetical protein
VQCRSIVVSAVLIALVGLSGCASKEDPDADPTPTPTVTPTDTITPSTTAPTEAPNTIDITITGDQVDPSGKTVEVPLGETVTLVITADRPGELHVHSTPEQEIPFDAGTSTHELDFAQPGVVAVEDHDLDKVIVNLEVS